VTLFGYFRPLPYVTSGDNFPNHPHPCPWLLWQFWFLQKKNILKTFLVRFSSKWTKNVLIYFDWSGWPTASPMYHLVTLSRPRPPHKKSVPYHLNGLLNIKWSDLFLSHKNNVMKLTTWNVKILRRILQKVKSSATRKNQM